jgi:hypothetical protein
MRISKQVMQTKKFLFLHILCVLVALDTVAQEPGLLKAATRKQVIDSTCRIVLRNYVHPEIASKMAEYLQQKQRRAEYDAITDWRRFATILTTDLRKIHSDNHLSVRYDPELQRRIRTFVATSKKDSAEQAIEKKQNFLSKS